MNTALWSKPPVFFQPLRVVRVAEDQRPPKHTAGRMVISGRMADVCAELDRLIALENQRASFSN